MSVNHDIVEQIVANVLAELQPAKTVRTPLETAVAKTTPPAQSVMELNTAVITADLLAEQIRPGQAVRIGRKSILTPSARDWLASRKIAWSRTSDSTTTASSARWQLVLTSVTPAVSTLRQSLTGWKSELLGTPAEAAEHAARVISASEFDGVLALCQSAEVVACLANRHAKIRAAVLGSTTELHELATQMSPNMLVVNPRGKSFIELRNFVRAVGTLSKPNENHPWASRN